VNATFNLVSNDPTSPTVPIICTGTAPWKLSTRQKIGIGAAVVGLAVLIVLILDWTGVIKV
jgi:hypothetical protein